MLRKVEQHQHPPLEGKTPGYSGSSTWPVAFAGVVMAFDLLLHTCKAPSSIVFRVHKTAHVWVAGLMVATSAAGAAPANKCVVNGTVTYQQTPCPSGQARQPPTIQELNAAEKQRRAAAVATPADKAAPAGPNLSSSFSCDGRQYCSQMKSCAEAKYFLANCPGVKMDGGNKNGIPCEQQWCVR
nr:excalibur calcium-binding domain-containing protein [uncultured Albidiferax sp.]